MLLKFRNKSKKKLWSSTISLHFPDMTSLCRVLLQHPRLSTISLNSSTLTLLSVHKCSENFQRVRLSSFGGAGDGRGPYKAAPLGHARPQGAIPHFEPPKQRITLPVPVQVKKSPPDIVNLGKCSFKIRGSDGELFFDNAWILRALVISTPPFLVNFYHCQIFHTRVLAGESEILSSNIGPTLPLHRKCTGKFPHCKLVKELCWINDSAIRCRKLLHFAQI